MPVPLLEKSFQKQTEIMRKKLEDVSPLEQAPFHPETGRPKTSEVKVLRNHLMQILSDYVTVYTEVTEVFDKIMEMEEGEDRDVQEEFALEMVSTHAEMVSKAQVGIGTLGVLLEEYDDFIQKEEEREERERQDHKEREERKQKVEDEEMRHRFQIQEMERKHTEVMERLRITEKNRVPPTRGDEPRGERSAGKKIPKIQSQESQMDREKVQVE